MFFWSFTHTESRIDEQSEKNTFKINIQSRATTTTIAGQELKGNYSYFVHRLSLIRFAFKDPDWTREEQRESRRLHETLRMLSACDT